ncbi:MAG: hypothetical protein KC731_36095 [Myxococcales bacterium]|nr:hypothetical protein [Myxococcales bacterium]
MRGRRKGYATLEALSHGELGAYYQDAEQALKLAALVASGVVEIVHRADLPLRKIAARYPSTCAGCGKGVATGDPVLWAQGIAVIHELCKERWLAGKAVKLAPPEERREYMAAKRSSGR